MPFRNFFLFLFFAVATNVAAQTSVDARLDSAHILIGSQTRLTLTVRTKQSVAVVFPDFSPKTALSEGIEIVRVEQTDTTSSMAGILELRRDYVLTSFDSADYHFLAPPVIVGDDTLHATDTLRLCVSSVPVDTLHLEQFYGAKDVLSVPFTLSWRLVVLWVLAFMFSFLAVWQWRKYKSLKPRVKRVVTMPPLAAHEVAIEKLHSLQVDASSFADEAVRCDAVVKTLRIYIKSRFGLDCSEMTSSQMLDTLHLKGHTEALEQLSAALRATDYVRFAGQRGRTVVDYDAFAPSFAYIEATKEELPPREPIVTEKVEAESSFLKRRRVRLVAVVICILAALACIVCLIIESYVLF